MSVKELEKKLRKVPAEKFQEVDKFLNSILKESQKHPSPKRRKKKFDFSWEGALAEEGKKIASVGLQHQIWEDEMKKYERYR